MKKSSKRKKLPAIKALKRKSWGLMSQYIRRSNIIAGGYNQCVTCKCLKPWKEMHAGHFIHASKGSLVSYDKRNIWPQCVKCNTYQGGRLIEYTLFIQENYGTETIDELKQLKQTIMKRADFDRVIEDLENDIRLLEG
jgi:5-methylcytosine-specific restriction endonuclease McrA